MVKYDDLLYMKDITKVYGNGVLANQGVNLSVKEGEIHALWEKMVLGSLH